MIKFLAVLRHEYKKVVFKWSFLIGTLLLPFIFALFAIVPAIIFSIQGEPTRIAVVDRGGKIGSLIAENLTAAGNPNKTAAGKAGTSTPRIRRGIEDDDGPPVSFTIVPYETVDKTLEQARDELYGRITKGDLDAFLIVPDNFDSPDAVFEYRSRKSGDFLGGGALDAAVNNALRTRRIADANISEAVMAAIDQPASIDKKGIDESGRERESSGIFAAAMAIGLMIYLTLATYGQAIVAAVVAEKETRIAEILFSSAPPFMLMLGKLFGVGLAGLTQLAIWLVSAAVLTAFAAGQFGLGQAGFSLPQITPLMLVYFCAFFIIGFFLYASIFALIGSVVTTAREGSQFSFPPIMLLLVAFYFSLVVIRDPNSTLSFWLSLAPFMAPITMPVRILAETPPVWQILLAIVINAAAIAALVWIAARVYRVGMLMYGKRATLPEVVKWIRRA